MVATKYRSDIQVLRGLAVLMVIGFHSTEYGVPFGYLGVDIFFVISGFVITPIIAKHLTYSSRGSSLKNALRSYFNFLENRFWRLFPALISSLALSVVLVLLLAPISDHERFSKQGLLALIGVGNLGAYLFNGDYFSPNPNPLIHLWSLSVEAQIYAIVPLMILISYKFLGNIEKTLFLNYLFFSIISFYSHINSDFLAPMFRLFGIESFTHFNFYFTFSRFWQFGLGGLLYLYGDKGKNNSIIFRISVLLIFSLGLALGDSLKLDDASNSVIVTLLSTLVIKSRALEIIHGSVQKLLVWIGYRSYSIYLIHMPILYTIKFSPVLNSLYKKNSLMLIMFGIFVTIILGSLNFSIIESRFRSKSGFKNLIRTRKLFSLFSLLVPFSLTIMLLGVRTHYWGLEVDRATSIPFAGNIDTLCDRQSSSGPPCEYLVNGSQKTLLLLGDSYATQISQVVIDAGNSLGWNVIVTTHGNCPLQFIDPNLTLTKECVESNLSTLKWVKTLQPNALVIANRLRPELDINLVGDAIYKLKKYTPNLIVFGNTPEFPDRGKFMSRRPLLMQLAGAYNPPHKFEIDEMNFSARRQSNIFLTQMEKKGLDVIDLWGYFCDKTHCRRHDTAGWLYTDANHLSIYGADFLKPILLKLIGRW